MWKAEMRGDLYRQTLRGFTLSFVGSMALLSFRVGPPFFKGSNRNLKMGHFMNLN